MSTMVKIVYPLHSAVGNRMFDAEQLGEAGLDHLGFVDKG